MTAKLATISLRPDALPDTPEAWLAQLRAPVRGVIPGADRARARVVSTLLHGNEPSGFRAVHGCVRAGIVPATDIHVFLGNVPAARHGPGVRVRPGERDLNRCFRPPWDGAEGALARRVLDEITALRPEVVIDLHNTTGATPAYAVVTDLHPRADRVATLFAPRIVKTDLRIGALIEATAATTPSLVVECGLAGSAAADALARASLEAFFTAADLDALPLPATVQHVRGPMRVRLAPGTRAVFGDAEAADPSLRLAADLDGHNFVPQPAGLVVGRVSPPDHWPLSVEDAEGADRSREWFALEAGALRLRRPALPLMATVDPEIAAQDCLCYLAAPGGQSPEPGA